MSNFSPLSFFIEHKVAANLLMVLLVLGGIFALNKLNIRYFPDFQLDIITVRVAWSGASAEDVETAITTPLEQTLRSVDHLHKLSSTSAAGVASITLEMVEGSDKIAAVNQVKQKIDEFRNLAADAEQPVVTSVVHYEQIARLLIYGTSDFAELRNLSRELELQLSNAGIAKIKVVGLPKEEISIQVPHQKLQQLGLSLAQIASRIAAQSRDFSAGSFGEQDSATQLRSLAQKRSEQQFADITVLGAASQRIKLGDIAAIKRRNKQGGVTLSIGGKPAVQMILYSAQNGDIFQATDIFYNWLAKTKPLLPDNITLHVYDENWQLIDERINLLLVNGGGGLLLVLAILFLFLSPRIAWWIALGIPISFMATMLILYFAGGSINMISLFALIMALGIIVDDAIVVGEDSLSHYQNDTPPLLAVQRGATRMFTPVLASSLTTVAAFIPLMMVGGTTGKILFAIPLIIVAAIIASVVESFLVLPNHLYHGLQKTSTKPSPNWRQRFNARLELIQNRYFKRLITAALQYRAITLSLVVALFIIVLGLLASGRLQFRFFPTPESSLLYANASFVPGTPKAQVSQFLQHLETSLTATAQDLTTEPLLATVFSSHNTGVAGGNTSQPSGEHLGAVTVELLPSDLRTIRNRDFIKAWKQRIKLPAGLDTFNITSRIMGPASQNLSIRLLGNNPQQLKLAALELAAVLRETTGVRDVADDMPYGRKQLIYTINARGKALGLTNNAVGRQLRTAFDGKLVQLFQDGNFEVEVKISLPTAQKQNLSATGQLQIVLDDGTTVPLNSVVDWSSERGFEILRHWGGALAVEISAQVDEKINNTNVILAALEQTTLPQIAAKHAVSYSLEGAAADQSTTLADMRYGMLIGLALIYLILAWVFASYSKPLVVMITIPFGLIGALLGHLFLGIDLTILSLFGLFGLSGIVINDSIILLTRHLQLLQDGIPNTCALITASCQRLRAVILTSITTIAGLAPLLFETSLQAQFLIPMATSIAFGLLFSTVLVLLVVPVLLSYCQD